MIFDSADLNCRQFMFLRHAADVCPNAIFNRLMNKILPMFRAENDVIKQ